MKVKISTLKKLTAISFITLFAAFLVIPNTGLPRSAENAKIVALENRRITAFPTASTDSKKFYSEFEKWYCDRLRFRTNAISLWGQANYKIDVSVKDDIIIGPNDWLFSKARCLRAFNDAGKKVELVKAMQEYCVSKNKLFWLAVPPNSESIYRDIFPEKEKKKLKEPEYFNIKAKNLFKENNINYISLKEPLLQARHESPSNDLYFKDDHHWSYYGASIGADTILNEIKNTMSKFNYDGLHLDGSTRNAYKSCYYSNTLGFNQSYSTIAPWSKKFTNQIYLTRFDGKTIKLDRVVSHDILWKNMAFGEAVITNKAINNNIKLLIIGDSYSSYMMPYLSQYLYQVISTSWTSCQGNKKYVSLSHLIKKYNPDIVMFEILENDFFHPYFKSYQKIKIKD